MSFKADITSSICSDDIWSCGRAEFELVIGDVATLGRPRDQLLDRCLVKVEQRRIAAFHVFALTLVRLARHSSALSFNGRYAAMSCSSIFAFSSLSLSSF
jgi:hypothetical protein